jgi:hypothetical protein
MPPSAPYKETNPCHAFKDMRLNNIDTYIYTHIFDKEDKISPSNIMGFNIYEQVYYL